MNKFPKSIIIIIFLGIIVTLNFYGVNNQFKSIENIDEINLDNGILEILNYW